MTLMWRYLVIVMSEEAATGQSPSFGRSQIGKPWWRQQMETFSALLVFCAGNSPVGGEFPAQRPVTRSFDVFFDLRLNKALNKQSWGWWSETLSSPLWSQCDAMRSPRAVVTAYFLATILKCITSGKRQNRVQSIKPFEWRFKTRQRNFNICYC